MDHRWIIFSLVLICCQTRAEFIGSIPLSQSWSITSLEEKTSVVVETDPSISSPILNVEVFTAFEIPNLSTDEFVNVNGNQITVNKVRRGAVSSSNQLLPSLFACLTMLACTLSLSNGLHSSRSLKTGAVLVLAFAAVYTQEEDLSIKLTVRLPQDYLVGDISLNIRDGDVTGNGFRINSLNVNFCNTLASENLQSRINLHSIRVRSGLSICTREDLSIQNLRLISNKVNVRLVSNGNINVTFAGGYHGTYKINSQDNISVTGDCVNDGSSTSGVCGYGVYSNVELEAMGTVSASFGQSCGSDWEGDVEALDPAPVSPPLPSTVPAIHTRWTSSSDWRYITMWGTHDSVVDNSDVNTVRITTGQWNRPIWWLMSNRKLGTLRTGSDFRYTLSFLYRHVIDNNVQISRASVVVFREWRNDWNWPAEDEETTANAVIVANFTGPFTSEFTLHQITFSSPATFVDPVISVRFELSQQPRTTPFQFFFSNLTLTVAERTAGTPNLLTRDSEYINIRKPINELDPNPGTNCPHKESGLKRWEDPETWGGSLPNPSNTITIPQNTKVLVTSCSFQKNQVYQRIVIPDSSELIFNDARISLNVRDILVEGKFRMGSDTCRLNSEIDITFHGSRTTSNTIDPSLPYGSKGIAVKTGASIDVHGKQYHYTWTRLAASAWAGDDRIYLQDNVNWEPNQEIVITTTLWEDERNPQNEVRKIVSVQNRVILLDQPLSFSHYASNEYQAEVGLLTRRIVVRGNEADSETNKWGGHIIVVGEGRFSGVMAVRMGQMNFRAKYPFHFHMIGRAPTSYVRDSSCHHNFYRCVTIHGTHEVLVTRNVAFDVMGHTYYLEDGVEENSTISFNLAAFVHVIGTPADGGGNQGGVEVTESDSLRQPADIAASGFYITNAYNRFIGNAASGGWAGFSFPNLFRPIGLNQHINMDPSARTTLEFDGNTAHSSGYYWIFGSCIYVGGNLFYSSENPNLLRYRSGRVARQTRAQIPNEQHSWQSPKLWMRFQNTKAFLCQSGVAHWGDQIEIVNYEAHDVTRSSTLFGDAWMGYGIVTGRTDNPTPFPNGQGFQFYDTWTKSIITSMIFRNYLPDTTQSNPQSDNRVIISMTHSDQFKPQGISATRNITFSNVPRSQIIGHRIENTGASRYFNFIDHDGSLVLRNTPMIVGSHSDWWHLHDDCTFESDWRVWVCEKKPGMEIAQLDIIVPNFINSTYDPGNTHVGNMSLWGTGINNKRSSVITRNIGVTGVTGVGWYMYLNNGAPRQFTIKTNQIPFGTSILFATSYPAGTTFTITASYEWNNNFNIQVTQAENLDEVSQSNGNRYYFDGSNLFLKIRDATLSSPEFFERDGVRIYTVRLGYSYSIQANCDGTSFCAINENIPFI